MRRQGLWGVEGNRCDRGKRPNHGESDALDAEAAVRAVVAGVASGIPKTADGAAEMVRRIKIAHDTGIEARKTLIVMPGAGSGHSSASTGIQAGWTEFPCLLVRPGFPGLWVAGIGWVAQLDPLTDHKLIDRCAALRPGAILDPTGSVTHALRARAPWRSRSTEIEKHGELRV